MILAAFGGLLVVMLLARSNQQQPYTPTLIPTGFVAQPPLPHQTIDYNPLSQYPDWPLQAGWKPGFVPPSALQGVPGSAALVTQGQYG